jgi:tetratricopeptide (TPR) repeat protein
MTLHRYHIPLLLALTLAGSAFLTLAQEQPAPAPQPPQQGPAPGAPSPGTPSSPGRQPFPGQERQPFPGQDQQRQPFPEMQRPIFLSGKVVLEDGTPPPDSVTIERVCNGIARPEAYTDSKGRFSFQLGQNMGVMQDACVSSADNTGFGGGFPGQQQQQRGGFGGQSRGISERDLMGCELRAALPGYRSEIVNLSGRRMFDNPDVGTIILRRLGNVEGTTISMTSLQAPKDAKKAFEKAKDALKKKKADQAQKEFEKAVQLYPKYAVAWFELGMLAEGRNDVEGARKAYAEALSADGKYVSPYLQMALLSAKENKWQEVVETTDRVIKLNPVEFPQVYFYNSVANYNLRKMDAAERSAREAVKLDTSHRMPKAEHILAVILAEKQDYSGAAESLRNYLKFAPAANDAPKVREQLAEIEKLTGGSAKVQTEPTPQP